MDLADLGQPQAVATSQSADAPQQNLRDQPMAGEESVKKQEMTPMMKYVGVHSQLFTSPPVPSSTQRSTPTQIRKPLKLSEWVGA